MTEQRTHWPAVIAALFAGVVGALAFGKMSPALPLLSDEFHLSLIQAGWLVSAFNALAAGSAIFFGLFSDRIGALRLCIFGVLCLAAGGLLGALAPGAPLLVASRLIEGLGFIAAVVSAPGLITAATAPGRLGVAFGLWGSYLPVGVSLAPVGICLALPVDQLVPVGVCPGPDGLRLVQFVVCSAPIGLRADKGCFKFGACSHECSKAGWWRGTGPRGADAAEPVTTMPPAPEPDNQA